MGQLALGCRGQDAASIIITYWPPLPSTNSQSPSRENGFEEDDEAGGEDQETTEPPTEQENESQEEEEATKLEETTEPPKKKRRTRKNEENQGNGQRRFILQATPARCSQKLLHRDDVLIVLFNPLAN
jgi:hypothetical protein